MQLLGFPVQLIGLLALPYLGVRWFVDGEDAGKDIEEYAVSALPTPAQSFRYPLTSALFGTVSLCQVFLMLPQDE